MSNIDVLLQITKQKGFVIFNKELSTMITKNISKSPITNKII